MLYLIGYKQAGEFFIQDKRLSQCRSGETISNITYHFPTWIPIPLAQA